jgi:hypothetical protein
MTGSGQARVDAFDDRFERRRVRVECREHQPLPLGHARLRQADRGRVERLGAAHLRRAAQLAIERVGPPVVLAGQRLRAAAVAEGKRSGAMAADVVQGTQRAVAAAHDHERHAGDLRHCVVAGGGHQCRMGDELPARGEHRRAVALVHGRIDVAGGGQRARAGERLRRTPVRRLACTVVHRASETGRARSSQSPAILDA